MPEEIWFIRVTNKKKAKKYLNDMKLKGIESKTEWGLNAFDHFVESDKTAPKLKPMKRIIAPIDWQCMKCKKKGKVGEYIMYGTGGVMCPDCWVERLGDKRTADLIMTKRELKYDNKALKNETERRIQELMQIKYVMLIKEAYEQDRRIIQNDVKRNQRAAELMQRNEEYFKQSFTKEEEKAMLEKMNNLYEIEARDREDRLKEREDLRAKMDRANEIYKKFVSLKKKQKKEQPAYV